MQQNIALVFAQIMYIFGYVILCNCNCNCNCITWSRKHMYARQRMCLVMYTENTWCLAMQEIWREQREDKVKTI